MSNTIDQLVSAKQTCKARIKQLEQKHAYLTEEGKAELREWRSTLRRVQKQLDQRIVQLPLL